jgi:hypothetical protein
MTLLLLFLLCCLPLLFGAAVTVSTSSPPTRHIFGDCAVRFFTISGASGSTLATGMSSILFATNQQSTAAGTASLITAISVSGGTLTFTSSAPMVTEVIMVIARVG